MNQTLAKDLGYLGVNVDQNVALDWMQTEVVNKARQGDKTALYKLYNFARHSEDPAVVTFARNQIALLAQLEADY